MATATYTPLAEITLGSSAASVTFSSISQAYRDLVLVVKGTVSTSVSIYLRFNADAGANYSRVYMTGTGSAAQSSSGTGTNQLSPIGDSRPDAGGGYNLVTNIMDYSATDKHKTTLSRHDVPVATTAPGTDAVANRWASTSAITAIQVGVLSNNFATGTTFALYGVAA